MWVCCLVWYAVLVRATVPSEPDVLSEHVHMHAYMLLLKMFTSIRLNDYFDRYAKGDCDLPRRSRGQSRTRCESACLSPGLAFLTCTLLYYTAIRNCFMSVPPAIIVCSSSHTSSTCLNTTATTATTTTTTNTIITQPTHRPPAHSFSTVWSSMPG